MKFLPAAACLCCATLQASFLPVLHLDDQTLQAFDAYVSQFEKDVFKPFAETGRMSTDGAACCAPGGAGKPYLQAHANEDIANGSIHHFAGRVFVPGGTVDDVRRIMEDYPNYPKYFKPDVSRGSGKAEPDSTPADEHFLSHLTLTEATMWFNVQFECAYDTHYRRIDAGRWASKSISSSVKELRDVKDPGRGTYPEGDDHGFVWRTTTYWFVRQANGGIDVELNSITLSRPNVPGFAWWATRRSHDAVEKMLRDTKVSVQALHSAAGL